MTTAPLVVLYGVPGVGKTALAAEAPDSVWIQFQGEKPPVGVELAGWNDVTSYQDVVDSIGSLISDEHGFKVLVIDSVSGLEGAIQKETCARNGWQNIEEPGYGKGYVASAAIWAELLDGLNALRSEKNMVIVLIGHCEIFRFDSPTTDPYSRYKLDVHKSALPLIEAGTDLIAFINYQISLKEKEVGFGKKVGHAEGGGLRVIYTEERPGFIAKSRLGTPPMLTFKKGEGWSALAKYFPAPAEA
jgi:hypothetical protein